MATRHEGHRLMMHRRNAAVSESTRVREPYGIAQVFSMAFGVFFVVIGAIGLSRAGIDQWTSPTVEVAGMGATPLLSTIHLGLGVLALAAGAARWASRAWMTFAGSGLIAFGAIAVIERVPQMGWNRSNGVAYLIAGGLAIIATTLTPRESVAMREVRSDYERDVGHTHA